MRASYGLSSYCKKQVKLIKAGVIEKYIILALLIVDILKLNDYTPLDATVSPFLHFDPHTNTIILYVEFLSYDEVYTGSVVIPPVEIYVNERLL